MIETIIQYILSPIIVALVGYVVYLLKEQKAGDDRRAKGIMLLLRRELINSHNQYVIKGETLGREEYEDIVEVYECYKALGGNSMADKLYKEIDELKITEG